MTQGFARTRAVADLTYPVVVYSRDGREALALAANPASEGLLALKARLVRAGYQLVVAPVGPLKAWAAADTPSAARFAVQRFLAARESAP